MTRKIRQRLPLVRTRERRKELIAPVRSITIAGVITDHFVSRIRPGTTKMRKPPQSPSRKTKPAPSSGSARGRTDHTSASELGSDWSSRASRTTSTTIPRKRMKVVSCTTKATTARASTLSLATEMPRPTSRTQNASGTSCLA